MDTQTANSPTKEDIDKHVKRVTDDIRAHMPETYKAIQDKSKKIGNAAFLLVRRGIRGEPNCFWAMENGCVVGAPFTLQEVTRDIAQYMVTFACTYVCIWAVQEQAA
jgi:hypothetical protein